MQKIELSHQQQKLYIGKHHFELECIHQIFEGTANKYPNQIAVEYHENQLSFQDLNEKANQLAHLLIEKGVQKNEPVLLYLNRTHLLLIGILGIMKAGAAFVPVVPKLPKDRIKTIIQDAEIKLAVSESDFFDFLETTSVSYIDIQSDALQNYSRNNPNLDCFIDQLAYLIYTSGTTGIPKGAMIQHKAICSFFYTQQDIYFGNNNNHYKVGLCSPIHFDFSVLQWIRILAGNTIVVVPEECRYDGKLFIDYAKKHHIQTAGFTPSEMAMHIEAGFLEELNEITHLTLGGETVSDEIWKKTAAKKQIKAFNVYGPTECTCYVCCERITPDSPVNLGSALANTQLFVVDENNNEVPDGTFGELLIGGLCVGKGYLNDEERSRKKFVQIPELYDGPLYRSGDKICKYANGKYQFGGRIDRQIKLRGNRIELEEIESHINSIFGIKKAVCLLKNENKPNAFLAAYIKLSTDKSNLSAKQIKAELGMWMPDYMIPTAYVFISEFELTSNGKIDFTKLPIPGKEHFIKEEKAALESETETQLAEIWKQILEIDDIGANDHFFHLGGHSLQATQLTSLIHEKFRKEFSIDKIFEFPVLREQSKVIDKRQTSVKSSLIKKYPEQNKAPLSYSQIRPWNIHKLKGLNSLYNTPFLMEIDGVTDHNLLKKSLVFLVERHQSLRIYFEEEADGIRQKVDKKAPLHFEVYSLLDSKDSKIQLDKLIKKESHFEFDLEKGPLHRFTLIEFEKNKSILVLSFHHMITDGWSMGIFINELSKVYSSFYHHKTPKLEDISFSYTDFSFSQNELLKGEFYKELLSFWKKELEGIPNQLHLPTDFIRPAEQTFNGRNSFFTIKSELVQKIQEFSSNRNSSPYMLCMAAWFILLQKLSREDDLLTGSVIANRNHKELEKTMGFFSNTLLIRAQIAHDEKISTFLNQIKQKNLKAFNHQDMPMDKILEELNPERNLAYNPMFQVVFNYQNMPLKDLDIPEARVKIINHEIDSSKVDLSLNLREYRNEILGEFEYATDLFKEESIKLYEKYYVEILEFIIHNPDNQLKDIKLKSDIYLAENPFEYIPLTDLFLLQVEKHADKTAVKFQNEQLNYLELDQLSNQFAHFLNQNDFGNIIGFSLEKCLESIWIIWGILKSGKTYLPIDKKDPDTKKKFILNDAELKLVITDENQNEFDGISLNLSELKTQIAKHSKDAVNIRIEADQTAYIIYTSGTTGRPKGVCIPHQSLSFFTQESISKYRISEEDKMLQFASLSFDAAVEEIFPTLCSGAELVIRDEEMISGYQRFVSDLAKFQISILDLPTAFWNQWVEVVTEKDIEKLQHLRLIILGGEALKTYYVQTWFRKFSEKTELINTYGPTESTVVVTHHKVSLKDLNTTIPIGKPLSHVSYLIADSSGHPLPIGFPGELWIGGDCLASGYLNLPKETKSKFIDIEISGKIQQFYKSGDLVKTRIDGSLEFLGRIDQQVKIRGYRVEVESIEKQIKDFKGIKDALVRAKQVQQGQLDLVAYYLSDQDIVISKLQEFLTLYLPNYMIPAYFVRIDEIPLTVNKKINDKALPMPSHKERNTKEIKKPENELQNLILEIWKDLLKLEHLGINENFFHLGGHSLLAIQFISILEKKYQQSLDLVAFFKNPTIEQIASKIKTSSGEIQLNQEINKRPENKNIPLTPSQKRIWFLTQLEGANASYNIPFDFKITGSFYKDHFIKALEFLVQNHEILRTRISYSSQQPEQVILEKVNPDYQIIDISQEENKKEQIIKISDENALYVFDLAKAPLWRVIFVKYSQDIAYLLFNFHHIISDGWSVGLFIKELSQSYNQLQRGEKTNIENKLQYADFAFWQEAFLKSEIIEKQLNYWKKQLNNIPELLPLPTDFSRPAQQSFDGDEVHFKLDTQTTKRLRDVAEKHQLSLSMLFQSVFAILLYKYTQANDFVVGTPVANRKTGMNADMLGVFINNISLRFQLHHDQKIKDVFKTTKDILLEAFENQDAPFESVLEQLQLKRNLSISPVFQVMFNFLNAHKEKLELNECHIEYIDTPRKISKYDLSLIMRENDDGVLGIFEYNIQLFKRNRIERLQRHFLLIIHQIIENQETILGEISILCQNDQKLLKDHINNTYLPVPVDKNLTELLDEQALLQNDKTAVIFNEKQYSYDQIYQLSNSVAQYLIHNGIKKGDRIGVYFNRSEKLIGVLWGILKSGAAYIPLDPIYPADRIQLILEDADPKLILSENEISKQLPKAKWKIVEWNEIESIELEEITFEKPTAEDIAYIIYTSGSTGKPKGVCISHQALVNFLYSMAQKPGCQSSDLLLAVTTISFDIAGLEIFLPLLTGAGVLLAKQDEILDTRILKEMIEKHQPTIMQATPALWKSLINAGWSGSSKMKALCGGEAFGRDLANELLEKTAEIWNMYGPTETTIWSSIKKVEKDDKNPIVGIGKPIANTSFYIVNDQLQPLPAGVPGELLIGGKGLSTGYFKRNELTKEKFLNSPFIKNEVLYKTGDLAYYTSDGQFHYLERIDQQVKIRGFRIELGEIEHHLKAIDFIIDAVTKIHTSEKGEKFIAAYIISEKEDVLHSEIVSQLQQKLPDYMIPAVSMQLDKFPQTPNGKIDRKALPQPHLLKSSSVQEEPKSIEEVLMHQIWCKLLGKDQIGINEDFFAIGGHSLLATELMIEIEKQTKERLPLATLFQNSTIKSLASLLKNDKSANWKSLVPIKPEGSKKALYIVHGAGLNVLLFNTLVKQLDKEQPVYGLQAKGLDGKEKPLESIEEIAAHYLSEIFENDPDGPYYLGGFSLGGIIAFEMSKQLIEMGKDVKMLAMFDTVAYSSLREFNKATQLWKTFSFGCNQIIFNSTKIFKQSFSENINFIKYKSRSIKRRIDSLIYKQKVKKVKRDISKGEKSELPQYMYNVYEANNQAGDKYVIKACPVKVSLFRAKNQIFYIEDSKHYGWNKHAKKGVDVFEIPGNHNSIFAPPNDGLFAAILQKVIDENPPE